MSESRSRQITTNIGVTDNGLVETSRTRSQEANKTAGKTHGKLLVEILS